ncbi:MAG: endonuclease III [Puniceicoccales bacterium]|jgi:endonuclease-3|nr:endonuclease III [Puniceicoccales bacterium]
MQINDIFDRANFVEKILSKIYPKIDIPLCHNDPFTLLIAVILSAQCTDRVVNRVTKELFSMASTPGDILQLSVNSLESAIRPCGLFRNKARAIKYMAETLISRFNGKVPDSLEELESLPGVGHKTASVVYSQAFGGYAFPVDTHIHRLARRWRLSSGKNVAQTEADLKNLFDKTKWHDLHIRMILFGREFCKARGHNIASCQICCKLA